MPSPITSRVKRHPSFGPLKKDEDPKAETFTGEKTEIVKEDKIVKGKEKKETYTCDQAVADGNYSSKQECLDATKKRTGSVNPTKEGIEDNTRGTGEFEPDTVETIEKEVKTPGSRGDVYTETESRILRPWEIRQLNRSGRIADNRISSSSRRLTNLGATQDAEGNWSMPKGASAKDVRKFNKFNSKFQRNTTQKSNVDRGVKSGRGFGELIHSGQRKMTQSEINDDPGSVKAQEKLNADRAAFEREQAEREASANSITTSTTKSADQSVTPGETPFTQIMEKFEQDKQQGNYSFGNYNAGGGATQRSELFAKKGPMKKAFFKSK